MQDKLDDIPELTSAEEAARLEPQKYNYGVHHPSKESISVEAKLAAALNELSATDQAAVKEFLNVSVSTEYFIACQCIYPSPVAANRLYRLTLAQ